MNRETFPSSLSPLQGDISGAAGATKITVTGIQTIPVKSTPPTDKQVLTYDGVTDLEAEWKNLPPGNGGIWINGVTVDNDYVVFINTVLAINNGFALGVLINGV